VVKKAACLSLGSICADHPKNVERLLACGAGDKTRDPLTKRHIEGARERERGRERERVCVYARDRERERERSVRTTPRMSSACWHAAPETRPAILSRRGEERDLSVGERPLLLQQRERGTVITANFFCYQQRERESETDRQTETERDREGVERTIPRMSSGCWHAAPGTRPAIPSRKGRQYTEGEGARHRQAEK